MREVSCKWLAFPVIIHRNTCMCAYCQSNYFPCLSIKIFQWIPNNSTRPNIDEVLWHVPMAIIHFKCDSINIILKYNALLNVNWGRCRYFNTDTIISCVKCVASKLKIEFWSAPLLRFENVTMFFFHATRSKRFMHSKRTLKRIKRSLLCD